MKKFIVLMVLMFTGLGIGQQEAIQTLADKIKPLSLKLLSINCLDLYPDYSRPIACFASSLGIEETKSEWDRVVPVENTFDVKYLSPNRPWAIEQKTKAWQRLFNVKGETRIYSVGVFAIARKVYVIISGSGVADFIGAAGANLDPYGFTIPTPTNLRAVGKWNYSKQADSFTDADKSNISLFANDSNRAAFVLRCNGQEIDAFFLTGEYLGSESVPVLYRFDKKEAVSTLWDISTNGTSVFVPNKSQLKTFLMEAASASVLALRVTNYRGVSFTYSLDWSGFAAAFFQLNCAKKYF